MLSKENRELLVSGYTRLNSKTDIPYDLVLLFAQWLSNALYLIIENEKIQEFMNKENDQKMDEILSLQLTEHITAECALMPGYDDTVQWHVTFTSTDLNVTELRYYAESGCEEIPNSVFKGTQNMNITDYCWNFITPRSLCADKERLTFYIDIELISIDYKQDVITKYVVKTPIFHSYIEYICMEDHYL